MQNQIVDDPKDAVMQVDVLVSQVLERIKQKFDNEHSTLKTLGFNPMSSLPKIFEIP